MFELSQLEQLLAFAKHETLSGAAQELLISQPALSRSMQRLESEIGAPLFDRKKNKIFLNDNGKLAVEFAEKIMFDVRNMPERIREYDRGKRTVYIGSCAPAPMWRISHELSEIYTNLTISTELKSSSDIMQGFYGDMYNIAITAEPVKDGDILCYEYFTEHLMLSLPPAHPLAMYKEVSFSQIDGETMLLFSDIGFWHDVCGEKLPETEFIIQSERDAFKSLVKASALPSFTSDVVIDDNEANRIVVPITDKEANPTFYISIKKKDKSRFEKLVGILSA